MNNLTLAICSIVRDCDSNLKTNIPLIEELRINFKNSNVIVFENDSIDNTKKVLNDWKSESSNVHIFSSDTGELTIPEENTKVNKFFSKNRISKMARYRNHYLEELEKLNKDFDYVMVIDLDIAKINLKGIYDSFINKKQWDVVTANGYSLSPKLKRRYHDSYALVEIGFENIPQTEKSITDNQERWAFLRKGMPLLPVYSAFGGLTIYKYKILKGKRYEVLSNEDNRVEVKCEHFALHKEMQEKNKARIFINPNMELLYQKVNFTLIKKSLFNKIK